MVRKKGIEMLEDEEEMMKLTQASMDRPGPRSRSRRGCGGTPEVEPKLHCKEASRAGWERLPNRTQMHSKGPLGGFQALLSFFHACARN